MLEKSIPHCLESFNNVNLPVFFRIFVCYFLAILEGFYKARLLRKIQYDLFVKIVFLVNKKHCEWLFQFNARM